MARTSVAAQVSQAFDDHRHLTTQVALDGKLRVLLAQLLHVVVGKVLHLRRGVDAGRGAYCARTGAADAVDRGQRNDRMLMVRDIYSGDTSHKSSCVLL